MILLASRSPQRRALLRSLGLDHRVVASHYPEHDLPGHTPQELVRAHAVAKARDVDARSGVPDRGAILAADTAVVIDDRVLGKPADRAEAQAMLDRLSGRTHTVITGVCLRWAGGEVVAADQTDVTFRPIGAAQMGWYLDRGEWHGRAGGYAIQGSGAALVQAVRGDQTTVIGLPLALLVGLLERMGMAPWSDSPPGEMIPR